MKIYLAARYNRYQEMQSVAADLLAEGHTITSRWISGSHGASDSDVGGLELTRFAEEDLEDLKTAHLVVSFTEEPKALTSSRGGRHVELGFALALGKRVIIIGSRENVFHYLPEVEHYDSYQGFLKSFGVQPQNVETVTGSVCFHIRIIGHPQYSNTCFNCGNDIKSAHVAIEHLLGMLPPSLAATLEQRAHPVPSPIDTSCNIPETV